MSNLETTEHPIPSSPVFVIEGKTLRKCLDLTITSCVIPEGVEKIGDSAFVDCQKLSSLTFPSTLEVIGLGAFAGCSSLTSLEIPEGVTTLQSGAFQACGSLVSVTLPQSLILLGHGVFGNCKALTTINLPHHLDTLGNQCFQGCASLTWETIPDTIRVLGDYVFAHCHGIHSFTLPKTVERIGVGVLAYCKSLHSVTLLAPLETLPPITFHSCPLLAEIHLPHTLTHLGKEAFRACRSLTQIHIPEGVEEMGEHLFRDCTSLTGVEIPKAVHTLEAYSFCRCTSLTSLVVPDTIRRIKENVFEECTSLQEIHLPKDLKSMEYRAFYGCIALTRIYKEWSDTPCFWGHSAIPFHPNLEFLDLPVVEIMPLSLQYEYYCKDKGEEAQNILGDFLFSRPSWVDFALKQEEIPLMVQILARVDTIPMTDLDAYLQDSIERKATAITALYLEYQNKHYSPEEVEAYYTRQEMLECGLLMPTFEEFSRCWQCVLEEGKVKVTGYHGMESEMVIPKTLEDGTVIDSVSCLDGMYYSLSLEHLRIDADLQEFLFPQLIFFLKTLEITGTVYDTIQCSGIATLENFTYTGKGHKDLKLIFQDCYLRTFTVPDGVTKLLAHSFKDCTQLQSITIPESVVEIGEDALEGCSNLTVYGQIGSVAEIYCKDHGIPFVEMAEPNP